MADPAEIEVAEEGVVTIEVPAEGDQPVEQKKKAEPAPSQQVAPPPRKASDDPSKVLQEAIDNEKRLRQAAEQTAITERQRAENESRIRAQREQELQAAQENAGATQLQYIENEIANATRELTSLQNEERSALEAGNFEKVAEISTKKSRTAARLDRFEAHKADYDAQRARGGAAPTTEGRVVEPQQPQRPTFDQYVANFTPQAQAWLRAHPECAPTEVGGNATMNSKMMKGHYDALSQGFAPNSEEYFRVIEETTGHRKAQKVADEDEAAKPAPQPKQRQAQPAAPPTREPPGAPATGGTRTVRLSPEEQDAAKFSFPQMTPQQAYAEYAKNKVQLEREGKLGRTTH